MHRIHYGILSLLQSSLDLHDHFLSLQPTVRCSCFFFCQVWNLSEVMVKSQNPPSSHFPHLTLHLGTRCSRPLIWVKPGTLATFATGQSSLLVPAPILPPAVPPIPPPGLVQGQVRILPVVQPGIAPLPILGRPFQTEPCSDMEIWDVLKHLENSNKSSSNVCACSVLYSLHTDYYIIEIIIFIASYYIASLLSGL